MNLKALITLLFSAFYIFGGTWLYNKYYASSWCAESAAPASVPIIEKVKDPLMFKWSNPSTITYDKFPGFKANIMSGNAEGQILEITGKYFEGETAPNGYANMGMARADEIRKLFPNIPDTRIRLKAEKIGTEAEGVRTNEFTSAGFNWVDAPKEERKVIELANKALIYFNFNDATDKKVNQEVDDYLRKLSERLKTTTEKVVITGHTDSKGEIDNNQRLGMRRAKTVRDILIRYGVANNRITTNSQGEVQPAETNDTDAGRALNRRAVVQIVQ